MLYCPEKYKKHEKIIAPWEYFKELQGELSDEDARVSLAKFMRQNLRFTVELLTGQQLQPFQEIILKGLFNRNFNLCVFSRGIGKTYLAGVFCYLYCIFNPNSKILIAGPTFRTSRFILSAIRDLVQRKEAQLLAQAMGTKHSFLPDFWTWSVNGGSIVAIPLASGGKVRGFRANLLIIDEMLEVNKVTIDEVLMPFLVSPQDLKERLATREKEDRLIERGEMKEEDRKVFKNKAKLIGLSSASYTFQNLYSTYKDWKDIIEDDKKITDGTYFISQLAWNAVPPDFIDKSIIEMGQNEGANSNAAFQREYGAQFTDGSDSYFSMKKILKQSLAPGEDPSICFRGDPNKKYVLGIDPNLSNSENADDFAMCVLELDEANQEAIIVNQYAVAGKDMIDHINYLYYVITHFNIVLMIVDNMGSQFIESANASEIFTRNNIKLDNLEWDTVAENENFVKEMAKIKNEYNLMSRRIVIKQYFTTEFISKSNSYLQSCIDAGKVWFASPANGSDMALNRLLNTEIPLDLVGYKTHTDFVDEQDDLIKRTKNQLVLIEFTCNARGSGETYDIPARLKRGKGDLRARRDSYSAFLLANWAKKCYFDMINYKSDKPKKATFTPFMV